MDPSGLGLSIGGGLKVAPAFCGTTAGGCVSTIFPPGAAMNWDPDWNCIAPTDVNSMSAPPLTGVAVGAGDAFAAVELGAGFGTVVPPVPSILTVPATVSVQ
ncbi:MAG: hypothetical protein E6J72_03050, partial [Deltaproteobacteria bacterium]